MATPKLSFEDGVSTPDALRCDCAQAAPYALSRRMPHCTVDYASFRRRQLYMTQENARHRTAPQCIVTRPGCEWIFTPVRLSVLEIQVTLSITTMRQRSSTRREQSSWTNVGSSGVRWILVNSDSGQSSDHRRRSAHTRRLRNSWVRIYLTGRLYQPHQSQRSVCQSLLYECDVCNGHLYRPSDRKTETYVGCGGAPL